MCRNIFLSLGSDVFVSFTFTVLNQPQVAANQVPNSRNNCPDRLPDVYGLAPEPKAFRPSQTYNQAEFTAASADPCMPSCQQIMLRQMDKEWNWQPKFMKAGAPRTIALHPGVGTRQDDDDFDEFDPKGKVPRKPFNKKGPKGPPKKGKGPDSKKPPSKGGPTVKTGRGPRSQIPKNGGKIKGQVPPKPLGRSFIALAPADEEEEDNEISPNVAEFETVPDKVETADERTSGADAVGEISEEGAEIPDEQSVEEIPEEDEDDEVPEEQEREEISDEDEDDEIADEQDVEEIPHDDEGNGR
jgi:hypothetical protein